jgi:predicted lipid-binding transport protein (Tim44 family)
MRKTLTALAAAATFATAAVATPTTADARWWGWRGGALIGGLAAGAIIGGAYSAYASPYYYGY